MIDKKRLTKQEMLLKVQRAGLRHLLQNSQPFRQFVWTILNEAAVFYPTYSPGHSHETSYREGRRALGLEVLHLLKGVDPGILSIIEKEGNLLARNLAAAPPQEEEDDAPGPERTDSPDSDE